ncbi:MAG: flagellar biosynthesis repressor FlbT [Aliidongia sp.]
MPLSIPFPAGAKVIINGAVIQNSGSTNVTLTVHNTANVLRDKDVLTHAEANSPAKEVYYAVQNAYLFGDNREEWENIAYSLLDRHQAAVPEAAEVVEHIRGLMQGDKLYNALRASRRLIALEAGEPVEAVAHPGEAHVEPRRHAPSNPQQDKIGRLEGKLAELERRLAAIDPNA